MRIHVKPPWGTPGPPGPRTPGPQDSQDPCKTFRQAFEGVLQEFAMQFEAHLFKIPCEMKEKAFKTFRQAFEGVLKEFAMQFEAHLFKIP